MRRAPSRRRPRRRILVVLGVLVVLLPLLFLGVYLVVAKKMLSGPSLRAAINAKPEAFMVDWDEAVSRWPGRVTVRNLRIRGSDPNVQWIVILPEASIKYALRPLLAHKLVVTRLRPNSIQFRIRQKLKAEQAKDEARVRGLPPIPGFSDPPLRAKDEKPPEPEGDPFTIEVLDVATAAFDDVWFDGFRYQGPGALTGRFRLKPGYRAQIGPATATFSGGALAFDGKPAVTKLEAKLEATFEDWDVQELTENKVFRVVTAKAALGGPTPGVDFLDAMLQLGPKVHVSGGPGVLDITAALDHGIASGVATITAKDGKYTRPDLVLEATADASLKFAGWNLDGGVAQIGGTSLKVTDVYVSGSKGKTQGWWGTFEIPAGRLGKALTGRVVVTCRDGRPLLAFLGGSLPKWTQGLIQLDGLKASADVVLSDPRTTVRNLKATGEKFEIEGMYDRRGEQSAGAFLIESGVLHVGVELHGGIPTLHLVGPRDWFEKQKDLTAGARR